MNAPKNETSTTSAPAGVVVSLAALKLAVDAAFADLETKRADYDAEEKLVQEARVDVELIEGMLLLAERCREKARQAFWGSSDQLNAALVALHAAQRSAAGGAS